MRRSLCALLCGVLVSVGATTRPAATKPGVATWPITTSRPAAKPRPAPATKAAGVTPASMLASVPGQFRPGAAIAGTTDAANGWLAKTYVEKVVTVTGEAAAPLVKTVDGKTIVSLTVYARRPERLGRFTVTPTASIDYLIDAADAAQYAQVKAGTPVSADLKLARCEINVADPKAVPSGQRPSDFTLLLAGEVVRFDLQP